MRRLGDDIIAGEAAREAFGGIMDGCGVDGALDLDSSLVARGDIGAGCAIDARTRTLDFDLDPVPSGTRYVLRPTRSELLMHQTARSDSDLCRK
jgi:hypothetical protein